MPLWLAGLIPLLWAALRIFVVANLVGFALRLLVGLGLYFYVFEPTGSYVMDLVEGKVGGMPAIAVSWLGFFNIDRYLSLILTAGTIAFGSNFILRMRPAS